MRSGLYLIATLLLACQAAVGHAGTKITATGGVRNVEGAAGGGLSPWALIGGYGSSDEWSATAFGTRVNVDDFQLDVLGATVAYGDRVELSYARQSLDVDPLNLNLEQDVFSAKVRLAGTFLYSAMPQISLGVQHKRQKDFFVPQLLGAADDAGTDVYLSASKLWFAALADRNLLLNSTLRYTEANELGLLGFGGPGGDRSLVFEMSAALFLSDRLALGYEYRQKPENLTAVDENDWQDLFLAWFPAKRVSLVAAYADLDSIAGLPDQTGTYLSLQLDL